MATWLDEAYGPASGAEVEWWYEHVTGFSIDPGAWDAGDVLVVETDLVVEGFNWSPEREIADMASMAAETARVEWAAGLQIVDAAGQNLSIDEYRPDTVLYSSY